MLTIGIDIGGTKIAGALVTADGTPVRQTKIPTPASDPRALEDAIVHTVASLVEGTTSQGEVLAVGIAAAGFIDATASRVYYAPNIAWRNEPLRERIEARIPYPVVVENDANAAGWAEYRFGAGRMHAHMTMLTIGTGVGGAVVVDGQLFRGGFGVGAELGHILVEPNGELCGCGQRGCIEQYGSGRALLRFANELAEDEQLGAGLRAARGADGRIDSDSLKRLLSEGESGAMSALTTLGEWIGRACAILGAVLDPNIFVIGGGVALAGEALLKPIRESYIQHMPGRGFHPEAEFAVAQMLNDAGVIGAADLARQHYEKLHSSGR